MEGANLKAKGPKKQKGDYCPRNPEESSTKLPTGSGVTGKGGRRKPLHPMKRTKGQASHIFRSLKFTSARFSRTKFSL